MVKQRMIKNNKSKSMQQNNMTEFHTLRVFVGIKNIHLLVRFPCRLSFQLKSDNGTTQTLNTYELKKGECEVNETIQCEFDIAYDNQRRCYEDKKMRLVVMMSSANGVIPAGMVMIGPCESEALERVEQTLALEKCPDRSATIRFTRWWEFLRSSTMSPPVYYSTYIDTRYTLKNNTKQPELKHSTYTSQNYGRQSKYSPAKRDTTPNRLQVGSSTMMAGQTSRSRVRTYTSPVYEQNAPHVMPQQSYMQPGQQEYRMAESYMEEPSYGHTASFYPMNQSAYVGNPPMPYGQVNQQPPKLQFGQKANYLKEIAKLKGEIKSLQHQDKWEQLIKVKDENETLMMELEKQKEKYRNIQKKDREYNLTIKELKDQLERIRLKLTNSEGLRNQLEQNIQQKDKKLKQSQHQSKKLQEKISDLQIQLSTNQKRIEFREVSLQEQLQKINQKYSLSESERQKITFEYNSLLTRMEENEKKYQLNQKDKERFFNEEKNKLNKKIDTLNQQLQKLKEDYQEKDLAMNQLSANHKLLSKKQFQKEAKLVQLQNQLLYSNVAFKKQEEQRKTLESEIGILRSVEQQRNTLKKKYNENVTQLTKTKEKFNHLNNDYTILSNKYKEIQILVQQLKKQKSQLNSRINILQKQIDDLTKIHDKKSKQQQALSAQNMNTNQRINDLKSKLQTQQRDFSEMALHYQEQINYLTKAKEYTDAEIQDLKWTIEKQREQYEELSDKLKELTEETLLLNKELLQGGDKIKRLEEELTESVSNSKALFNEKLSLEEKQRTLQQSVKSKISQNYQLSKKKLELEQDLYLLKEKLQQSQAYQKDKGLTDEKIIKEKEKEINSLNEESTKTQLQILHLREEINALNQSVSIKSNQLTHLKDNNSLLQEKINDLELKNEQTREQLKNSNFELSNTQTERDGLKNQLQACQKAHQKLKSDWQEYRTCTTNAIEQLVNQVSKDQDTSTSKQQALLIFPDMNISSMQVEAIKKRNTIISSYRQKISLLQKELSLNKQNLQKAKLKIQEKEAEHEFVLGKEKEKMKQLMNEAGHERELLTEELRKSDEKNIELMGEIQKLTNEIKKSHEIIDEVKSQTRQLIAERQHLKLQIKTLEQKILELKSLEIKSKASHESRFSQLNDHSEQQILKIKQNIIETERKVLMNEKIISQKEESIKRLENQLASVNNQRNRMQQKAIQLNEKVSTLTDDKKGLEKKIKLLQKQLKQQTQLFQQSQQSLNNQKTKLQQLKSKYNETFEQLTDSQVDNQKLKQEVQLSSLTITSLQTSLKQKEEKHRTSDQKLSAEIKQLKEKLITLNSQLELNSFINKQLEDQLVSGKEVIADLKDELNKRKEEIIKLGEELESKKNNLLQVDQSLNINKNEKETLRDENERLRNRITSLENEINENRILEEVLEMKEKELRKLREEQEINRKHYEKNLAEIRSLSTERNRLSTSRNIPAKDDDSKRKIRQLQQFLELKHYDLALQRKKWLTQSQRQKRHLIQQNSQLQQRIQDMQSEFDFQRSQLNKEIQSLGEQLDQMAKITQEKQEVIFLIQNLVKDLQNGNTSRVHELRHNVQQLKRSIQNRIRENSLSRSRRGYSSFEQDSNFGMRNSKEFNLGNHFVADQQSPSPKASLHASNGFHSGSNTNNILNESVKEVESQQLGTTMNQVQ